MTISRKFLIFATLGSLSLLLGAFAFQHLGGLPPCKMCIWQRWPHLAAIIIGALAIGFDKPRLALLGALAALTTGLIGFYHVGVEQKWWDGPNSCTSSGNLGLSPEDLLDKIMAAPVVRCDEIPWDLFGISMAGWNGILSLIFVVFWIIAFIRR